MAKLRLLFERLPQNSIEFEQLEHLRERDSLGIPAQVFEADVMTVRNMQHRRVRAMNNRHTSNTASWYTPSAYAEAARATMLCIDLDPASSLKPSKTVRAGPLRGGRGWTET